MLSTMICALILIAVFFIGIIARGTAVAKDVAKEDKETMKLVEYYNRRCNK